MLKAARTLFCTSGSILKGSTEWNAVIPIRSCKIIPQTTSVVIDGISFVYKINGDQRKFGDVANNLLSSILREADDIKSNRFDVVFDDSRENSIKDAGRTRKATDKQCIGYKDIAAGQIIRK